MLTGYFGIIFIFGFSTILFFDQGLVPLIVGLLTGTAAAIIGQNKQGGSSLWFGAGFLFGLLGLIAAIVVPVKGTEVQRSAANSTDSGVIAESIVRQPGQIDASNYKMPLGVKLGLAILFGALAFLVIVASIYGGNG